MLTTDFEIRNVGGIPFQVATLESACEWLVSTAIPRKMSGNVRFANAYNVALAGQDESYAELLTGQGINFPDGTPVAWFMNLGRVATKATPVRGPSFFPLALERGASLGVRHFFLGGTSSTLAALEAQAVRRVPDLVVAGAYSPPFSDIDAAYVDDCARRVSVSRADVVWIGLGTPKQDQLGALLSEQCECVFVNVGAAFDYLAGTVREAPAWLHASGFEWLHRLIMEPRRLWRRYLIGNVKFLVTALAHRVRSMRGGRG